MNTLTYWLAAICIPNHQPHKFLTWLNSFESIEHLFHATDEELLTAGCTSKDIVALRQPDWDKVKNELDWCNQDDRHILPYTDPDYPTQLREIASAPLVLYIRGNKSALSKPQLAIVGSRSATANGMQIASNFAQSLARSGLIITSGLASGIDGAGHKGALAAKGVTIGICGTGLNYVYPTSHRKLVEDIIAHDGAVVSEFCVDERPYPYNFPRRNRIIAGLSIGVLVIEAALRSGSLITARHALECGRDVFAVPGSIQNALSRGPHHLLRQGAKLVEKVEDILDEFKYLLHPVSTISQTEATTSLAPMSIECEQLLNNIDYETTPMDVIVLRSGLTASQISSILLILELNGHIESVTGGYIRVVKQHTRAS